jgi:hypothetical protein
MPLRASALVPIQVPFGQDALAPGAPAPGAAGVLPVPYMRQQQTNWCWAACCEMVFQFNAVTVQQCDMATAQFGGKCCAAPSSSVCNQGNWPEYVYPRYGFHYTRGNAPFTSAAVQAEINAGRPVEVYYAWNGGGAHVALIVGFYDNGDLEVSDPWYGSGRRTYAAVLAAYNLGAWTITYSNLRK